MYVTSSSKSDFTIKKKKNNVLSTTTTKRKKIRLINTKNRDIYAKRMSVQIEVLVLFKIL